MSKAAQRSNRSDAYGFFGVIGNIERQEERALTLHNLLQKLRMGSEPLWQRRKSPGKFKKQLEAVRFGQSLEIVHDLGELLGQCACFHCHPHECPGP